MGIWDQANSTERIPVANFLLWSKLGLNFPTEDFLAVGRTKAACVHFSS